MNKDLILIENKDTKWDEAIKLGVDLLVKNGYCTAELHNKIVESVNKNGPYFVIMPRVALAHAEPGDYINNVGLSLVKFNKTVKFSNDNRHEVNLLFTLSAKDAGSHMDLLLKFSTKFMNDKDLVDKIISANSIEEIYEMLKEV